MVWFGEARQGKAWSGRGIMQLYFRRGQVRCGEVWQGAVRSGEVGFGKVGWGRGFKIITKINEKM